MADYRSSNVNPNRPARAGASSGGTWAAIIIIGLIVLGLIVWAWGDDEGAQQTADVGTVPEETVGTGGTGAEDPGAVSPAPDTTTADTGVTETAPDEETGTAEPGETTTPTTGEATGDINLMVGTSDPTGVVPAEEVLGSEEMIQSAVGQSVKVSGEVNRIVTQSAFTLDSDGAVGGDELLVIYAGATPTAAVEEGAEAIVQGTVQLLDPANVPAGVDMTGLDEFQGRHAIIVQGE